jgi:hypothetical protein
VRSGFCCGGKTEHLLNTPVVQPLALTGGGELGVQVGKTKDGDVKEEGRQHGNGGGGADEAAAYTPGPSGMWAAEKAGKAEKASLASPVVATAVKRTGEEAGLGAGSD